MRILTIEELIQVTGGGLDKDEKLILKGLKEQIKDEKDKDQRAILKAEYKVLRAQFKGTAVPI